MCSAVLGWYFAFSPTPTLPALLGADAGFDVPFGIFAFLVLLAMASTSHDFWLAFLGPPVWKALHMAVYAAYASAVLHVGFGAAQDVRNPTAAGGGGAVHGDGRAPCISRPPDGNAAATPPTHRQWPTRPGWSPASPRTFPRTAPSSSARPRAKPWRSSATAAASPLSATFAPTRTGRSAKAGWWTAASPAPGTATRYRLEDGCSPPPFTEHIATYRLRLDGERVLLDPRPNPPGTPAPPLELPL